MYNGMSSSCQIFQIVKIKNISWSDDKDFLKGLKRKQKSERVLEVIIRALFMRDWYKITLTKLLKAGLL